MPGQGHLTGLAYANDWLSLRVLLSADAPPQRGFSVPFCATPACHELLRYQESHGSERGVGFSALHYCFIGHGHGRGTNKQAMAAAERMLEISSAHGLGLAEIATSNGILPLHVAAPCAPPRVVALLVLGYPAGMSMADSKGKLPIIRAESQSAPSTTCLASLYKACRRKDQTKLESMVADVLGREVGGHALFDLVLDHGVHALGVHHPGHRLLVPRDDHAQRVVAQPRHLRRVGGAGGAGGVSPGGAPAR